MRVDRRWRQAVADDNSKIAWCLVETYEPIPRCQIKRSSEIGTPQIILAALRLARNPKRCQPKGFKAGNDGWDIQTGMDGIAGAGVVECELQ
jgi:hypothetical protein